MADVTVRTKSGSVRGQMLEDGVRVWRGLPYARAPIGDLRFRAPQPLSPWEGTLDATTFGPICPQPALAGRPPTEPMDEDCLWLNIWSPPSARARPVMVFLHAGAFYVGSGSSSRFDGRLMAASGDVVVVTLNYRLGPLGFLDLRGMDGASGRFETNLGLRDQLAALCWVAENIDAFGGDPNNVTLFGQSAGAGGVACLVASPLGEGLFHAAIAQSAPARGVLDREQAGLVKDAFLARLGSPDLTFDDLSNLPVMALQDAAHELVWEMTSALPGMTAFQPVIDGEVVLDFPDASIRAGHARPVPLIIGTNEDEGSLFAMPNVPPMVPSVEPNLQKFLDRAYPGRAETIRRAYVGHGRFNETSAIAGDGMIWIPSLNFADAVAEHCPVWVYRFRWTSPQLMAQGLGSPHAVDVPFVFGVFEDALVSVEADPAAVALSREVQAAWTNFAHDHQPSLVGGLAWPAHQAPERATLMLDTDITIAFDPDGERRSSWGTTG